MTNVKVADILEREMDFVVHDWMKMVEQREDLMHISLNLDKRTGHVPQLLRDVIARLRLDVCSTKTSVCIGRVALVEEIVCIERVVPQIVVGCSMQPTFKRTPMWSV